MMRAASFALSLGLLALSAGPTPAMASTEAPALIGRWTTPGDGSVIEFGSCAEQRTTPLICGRIIALKGAAGAERRDLRNPKSAARNRRVLGLEIIHGLTEAEPGVWKGGVLYNPDDGHTYAGAIHMQGDDRLELQGCAMVVLCQTQVWRRLNP